MSNGTLQWSNGAVQPPVARALGAILNAQFNVSGLPPGLFGLGLGRGGVSWGEGVAPRVKRKQDFGFPVDPSLPQYDNAGSQNGDLRCHTALWGGPAVPASPQPPGLCT